MCENLSDSKINNLMILGNVDCSGSFTLKNLSELSQIFSNRSRRKEFALNPFTLSHLSKYSNILSNRILRNDRNNLIQDIINGTYTPGSCTIDGCTDSVTPQPQSQTTLELADNQLNNMNKDFGIANIKREDGNYDIFFKGKEVLEYKANLNGVGTLNNNQIDPIFKNLFNSDDYNTDNGYKNHIINGNQLYHARKASLDGDWETDTVYKIFSNCNFKIESIDSIRYEDTTESNETRVEILDNGSSVDVYDVSS